MALRKSMLQTQNQIRHKNPNHFFLLSGGLNKTSNLFPYSPPLASQIHSWFSSGAQGEKSRKQNLKPKDISFFWVDRLFSFFFKEKFRSAGFTFETRFEPQNIKSCQIISASIYLLSGLQLLLIHSCFLWLSLTPTFINGSRFLVELIWVRLPWVKGLCWVRKGTPVKGGWERQVLRYGRSR